MIIHSSSKQILIVLIYVDDIRVTKNDQEVVKKFTERLNKVFFLKDLGVLHYLGLEVYRDETGIYLNQRKNMCRSF